MTWPLVLKYRGEGKGRRGAITSFEGEIRVESNISLVIGELLETIEKSSR